MDRRNEPKTKSEAALRERLARLSEASLCVNGNLVFDTVRQGAARTDLA